MNAVEMERLNLAFARFRGACHDAGFRTSSPEIRGWMEKRLGFPAPMQIKDLPVERLEEFADLLEAKHRKNLKDERAA